MKNTSAKERKKERKREREREKESRYIQLALVIKMTVRRNV